MSKKIPNTIRGIGKPSPIYVAGQITANRLKVERLKRTGRFTPEEIAYIKYIQNVKLYSELDVKIYSEQDVEMYSEQRISERKTRYKKRTLLWP